MTATPVPRKPKPGRSLADLFPDIAAELDPDLNGGIAAAMLAPSSRIPITWTCACGTTWITTATVRINTPHRSVGCTPCTRARTDRTLPQGFRTPKPGKSFADLHPVAAREWAHDLNADLATGPEAVVSGSQVRVWWRCNLGHEWQTSIGNRRFTNCPYCAPNGRLLSGFNDLQTLRPELAAEYSDKNEKPASKVRSGSAAVVWWCCKVCDYEWRASLMNRTGRANSGCPSCYGHTVLRADQALAVRAPHLVSEWHPTKNGDLTPDTVHANSHKMAWWQCSGSVQHTWQARIKSRMRGNGCRRCGVTGTSREEINLFHELAQVTTAVHSVKVNGAAGSHVVDILLPDSKTVVEYDGSYWHRNTRERDRRKTESLTDAGYTVVRAREDGLPNISDHDVQVEHGQPYETALAVMQALSRLGVLSAAVVRRYKATGVCQAQEAAEAAHSALLRRAVPAHRSLATCAPATAQEWHPTLNGDLAPNDVASDSEARAWWLCGVCGHGWEAPISRRTRRGSGCPPCGHRKPRLPRPGRSLEEGFPEVALIWHPTLNGGKKPSETSASSNHTYWWLCRCGNEWQARVCAITAGKPTTCCPPCSRLRRSLSPPNSEELAG